MEMRSVIRSLAAAVAACLALAVTARAQQSVDAASVSGRVLDANGAVVVGVTLTLTAAATGAELTVVSDDQGRFTFARVPVGDTSLKAERAGFRQSVLVLSLTVGQSLAVDVNLEPSGPSDMYIVDEFDPAPIDSGRSQISGTIAPHDIESLPLNGRNYLDLALLVPGVSRTNTGSNQRFAETSAVPGTGISVTGQRNINNSFVVDGVSANDDAADLAGTFYSQEVIREFQVITSGADAEFGRASGGVVNILTETGTNVWHGRVYGFLRNQRLDARNPLAARRDPLTQGQYGATIGGPVVKDRSFVFANFEQTRRNDATVVTISPASAGAIDARLDALGFAGPRIETGVVPGGLDTTNGFVRSDQRFGDRETLAVRYSVYDLGALNSRTVGGLNAVSRGTGLDARDQTVNANLTSVLDPATVNEARFQFTRSRLDAPPNDLVGPAVNVAGVASFGTATFSPTARDVDQIEAADTLSMLFGNHAVKAGGDFLLDRVDVGFPGAVQGVYGFNSLDDFLAGRYASFQQAFGAPDQFQSNPNLGLFAEDSWRVRPSLTVNAGVRYDAQFLPDPVRTDANNLAPRVGIAWAPGDGRTVVRASAGLFYERLPLRATSNALQRDGSKYVVAQIAPGQPGAPTFPSVLAAEPDALLIKPSVTRIDPDIDNASSFQTSLQVERVLYSDALLSVGYLHLRGEHLLLSRNVNVPRFPATAGVPNLGRPDPDFGNVSRFESSGDSYYDGLVVAFEQRPIHGASERVSYTLSKSIDDAGNFFFSAPQNNFDLADDRGLSDNDQRHRFVASGTYESPASAAGDSLARRAVADFRVSSIFTYASAPPFNVLLGSDRNFDTSFNDRPVGVGRNTGRGFSFASLDARVSRVVRVGDRATVELLAESFNLLNRANYQIPNATFGPGPTPLATFGRPTAAFDPRQIQFGLRVSF